MRGGVVSDKDSEGGEGREGFPLLVGGLLCAPIASGDNAEGVSAVLRKDSNVPPGAEDVRIIRGGAWDGSTIGT